MEKDRREQNHLISNKCVICSKKMKKHEIDHTFTMEMTVENLNLPVTVPICSDECGLAFGLRRMFLDDPERETESVINHFSMSEDLNNKDLRIAISTLIANEEDPLKQSLIEYLDYAEKYGLL